VNETLVWKKEMVLRKKYKTANINKQALKVNFAKVVLQEQHVNN
jgi:hypothetical protein